MSVVGNMRGLYRLKEKLADFSGSVSRSTHTGFLLYLTLGIALISQSNALSGEARAAVLLWTALCVFKWYGLRL